MEGVTVGVFDKLVLGVMLGLTLKDTEVLTEGVTDVDTLGVTEGVLVTLGVTVGVRVGHIKSMPENKGLIHSISPLALYALTL